jgi:flagellar basal-body rod protein FlgB
MAGINLFDFSQQLLTASMRLLAARHELITANIANVDTPGYRARDLDFGALMQAMGTPENPPAGRSWGLQRVAARPFQSWDPAEPKFQVAQAFLSSGPYGSGSRISEPQDRLDGNQVSLDREIGLLAENSLLYETSLTLLSRTLAELRYAIEEGKR